MHAGVAQSKRCTGAVSRHRLATGLLSSLTAAVATTSSPEAHTSGIATLFRMVILQGTA